MSGLSQEERQVRLRRTRASRDLRQDDNELRQGGDAARQLRENKSANSLRRMFSSASTFYKKPRPSLPRPSPPRPSLLPRASPQVGHQVIPSIPGNAQQTKLPRASPQVGHQAMPSIPGNTQQTKLKVRSSRDARQYEAKGPEHAIKDSSLSIAPNITKCQSTAGPELAIKSPSLSIAPNITKCQSAAEDLEAASSGIHDREGNTDSPRPPSHTYSIESTSSTIRFNAARPYLHKPECMCEPCRHIRHQRRKISLKLSDRLEICRKIMMTIRDPDNASDLKRGRAYGFWLKLARLYVKYETLVDVPIDDPQEEDVLFVHYLQAFRALEKLVEDEQVEWGRLFGEQHAGIVELESAQEVNISSSKRQDSCVSHTPFSTPPEG